MKYWVDPHIGGFPGLGKATGKLLIWGFSPEMKPEDTELIRALLATGGGSRVLLAVKLEEDVLAPWRRAGRVQAPLQEEELFSLGNNWFGMVSLARSPSLYAHLAQAWAVWYAAEIHVISTDLFWLGYSLSQIQFTSEHFFGDPFKNSQWCSVLSAKLQVCCDGECVRLDTWRGVLPEIHIREIESVLGAA